MKNIKFVTGLVRLSYANVWEAQAPMNNPNGPKKFSAALLISKSDTKTMNRLKAAIKTLLNDAEVQGILKKPLKEDDLPIRDGDEKEADTTGAYKGHWYVNAKANEDRPPVILDRSGNEIMDRGEVYSGCYCQAVIGLYPYNKGSNRGIGVGLNGLRKIKDGDHLGGGSVSSSDFSDDLIDDKDLDGVDDIFG